MNKEIVIKATSTCPQRANVLSLLDEGKASFRSVFGELKQGKIPVYVDELKPENLYGFIHLVKDENLSMDEIMEMVPTFETVTLLSHTGNMITADVTLNEEKTADIISKPSDALLQIAEEKIAEGLLTKEEFDERYEVMAVNKVPESLKMMVFRNYRKYNKAVHRPSCVYVDPYIDKVSVGQEGIISEGLRNAVNRMAVICEGEKSVGKNVYMETIAWLLGMPLYMIAFSRNMNPSSIYGEKSTDNSAAEALKEMKEEAIAKVLLDAGKIKTDFAKAVNAAADFELQKARAASVSIVVDQSELYDWMIDGGVLVLNEMNMAEANFFSSFINPLTDGTGFLFIPGRGEVKMHEDCVLFGTQNADYEGVQQQNEATMSRFNSLYFKQPESVKGQFIAAVGSALKKASCTYSLPMNFYDQAQAFYSQCLKAVRKGDISNAVLNIRGFVRALTTVAKSEGFCSLKRWIEVCVINTCPTDERQALHAIADSIISL